MTTQPPAAAPARRGARIVFSAILLLVLLGMLLLLDRVASRLYPRLAPKGGQHAVAALLNDAHSAATGFFVEHPYLFYAFRPGLSYKDTAQFNSQGYRGPEVTERPAPGVIRILCMGGSTTASFPYVLDWKDAWPKQLETLLNDRLGPHVEVINAGLNAGNSADMLAHYMFRDRYLGAQIVVMHTGGNDANALFFSDYSPEYTHFTKGWQVSGVATRPHERAWLHSGLIRWCYALWLNNTPIEATLGRKGINEVAPATAMANVERHEPVGFERNLRLLLRTIRDDRAEPVFFPFVWAPESHFKKDSIFGAYHDALVLGFQKNRTVMDHLADELDVALFALPPDTISESHFKDWCHLNSDGEAIKAHFLADAIEPLVRKQLAKLDQTAGEPAP